MSPDGSKSLPPEERLLRLIRGKGASPAPLPVGGPSAADTPSAAPPILGQAGTVPPRSLAKTTPVRSAARGMPAWSLTAVNIALGCVAAGLLVAIGVVVFAPSLARQAALDAPVEVAPSEPSERQALPMEAPPAPAAPLSAAAARPLFVSPAAPGTTSAPLASVPLSQQAKELAGRLSVLGIVEGEPRQAIIEDAQTKKTYFVSVGQQVVDGMVVTEVRTDRVVLDVDGQRLELSL